MAIHLAIARPYAEAAFEYAKEQHDLPAWELFLNNAAATIDDLKLYSLLNAELLSVEQIKEVLTSILGTFLNDARRNFLRLIIQNKRTICLPEIAYEFSQLLTDYMQKSKVRLVTAVDASDTFKANLVAQLSKKIKKEVILHCEKDPSILGGAVIYINNKVIDGSLRGKLNRLLEFTLR